MRRRDFITGLGGVVAVGPLGASAQQARLVAVLMNGNANELPIQANVKNLADGLSQLGWVEGKNLRLEVRWKGGNAEGARNFAAELVGLKPSASAHECGPFDSRIMSMQSGMGNRQNRHIVRCGQIFISTQEVALTRRHVMSPVRPLLEG